MSPQSLRIETEYATVESCEDAAKTFDVIRREFELTATGTTIRIVTFKPYEPDENTGEVRIHIHGDEPKVRAREYDDFDSLRVGDTWLYMEPGTLRRILEAGAEATRQGLFRLA